MRQGPTCSHKGKRRRGKPNNELSRKWETDIKTMNRTWKQLKEELRSELVEKSWRTVYALRDVTCVSIEGLTNTITESEDLP